MSKKKKENKHQLPETGATSKTVLHSKYMPEVIWTDVFTDGTRDVVLNDRTFSSTQLLSSISAFAHSFGLPHAECWNVKLSQDKFYEQCAYDLTPVFAIYWFDYHIDRLGEALYICKYSKVFKSSPLKDTTRRDKQADKDGLAVQEEFMKYVKELA